MKHFTVRQTMVQRMRDFHTWGGLFFGWVLFIVFFTGTLAVFEPEISYWMNPEVRVQNVAASESLAAAEKALRKNAADADVWFVILPQGRSSMLDISWKKNGQTFDRYINPTTGDVIKGRGTDGGEFFSHFHYELHHKHAGTWLVNIAGLVMMGALISGIMIRRNVIKDFFCLRWRKNWLNVHMMTGVLTLPFVVLITYSGLVMTFKDIMPVSLNTFYKTPNGYWNEFLDGVERPKSQEKVQIYPLAALVPAAEEELGAGDIGFVQVQQPDKRNALINFMRRVDDRMLAITDRATFDGVTGEWLVSKTKWDTQATIMRSFVGLHIGKFGGYPMAWGYFIFGLIGCVMIATGLIFFTIKRRFKYEQEWGNNRDFFRAAEAINIAVITGCIIASISYLWANRLLPLALKDRADAEVMVFFFIWLLMCIHAFWRPKEKAWVEQLKLAAGFCVCLPLLNALTTSVGLPKTLLSGDWITAGVDLTSAMLGLILWVIAWMLEKRWGNTI